MPVESLAELSARLFGRMVEKDREKARVEREAGPPPGHPAAQAIPDALPEGLAAAAAGANAGVPSSPAAARPGAGGAIPFVWAADIRDAEDAAPELVEGILTAGAMGVIYGESNSGKTYLALDLACAVARGVPWLNRRTTQGAAIYVAAEGARTIERRVRAYRKHHRLEGGAADFPLGIVKTALDLCTNDLDTERLAALIGEEVPGKVRGMEQAREQGGAQALEQCDEAAHAPGAMPDAAHAPASETSGDPQADRQLQAPATPRRCRRPSGRAALIVIDTLSRAIAGGNENASEDMGALVRNGDRLREITGAHVLWVHHCGKDAARGARGHSLLRAATDTEIEVTQERHSGLRTARVTKQRDLASNGEELHAKLRPLELGVNQWGGAVTACVVEGVGVAEKPKRPPRPPRPMRPEVQRAFDAITELSPFGRSSGAGTSVIPPGKRLVGIDEWREAYKKRCGDIKENTFRTNWSRVQTVLFESERISFYDRWVWLC
jgi:hypothetical protein